MGSWQRTRGCLVWSACRRTRLSVETAAAHSHPFTLAYPYLALQQGRP